MCVCVCVCVCLLYPRHTKYIGGTGYIVFAFSVYMFIPPAYEVYRGNIVFAFSVYMFVCV